MTSSVAPSSSARATASSRSVSSFAAGAVIVWTPAARAAWISADGSESRSPISRSIGQPQARAWCAPKSAAITRSAGPGAYPHGCWAIGLPATTNTRTLPPTRQNKKATRSGRLTSHVFASLRRHYPSGSEGRRHSGRPLSQAHLAPLASERSVSRRKSGVKCAAKPATGGVASLISSAPHEPPQPAACKLVAAHADPRRDLHLVVRHRDAGLDEQLHARGQVDAILRPRDPQRLAELPGAVGQAASLRSETRPRRLRMIAIPSSGAMARINTAPGWPSASVTAFRQKCMP